MELISLTSLLKVNGLSAESSAEDITAALRASAYQETEIQDALAILKEGKPAAVNTSRVIQGAYMTSVLERTKAQVTQGEPVIDPFGGRVDREQFWYAAALLTFISIVVFLLIEVTVIPLFSILSGLSLTALPDLVKAPTETLVLLALGCILALIPLIPFIYLGSGLQIRRYHDYGLSGTVWFAIICAEVISFLILYSSPTFLLIAVGIFLILNIVLLSWSTMHEENIYGASICYTSTCAAMMGSLYETGNVRMLFTRYVLPVIGIEAVGLLLAFGIHTLLPKAHLPPLPLPEIDMSPAMRVTHQQPPVSL